MREFLSESLPPKYPFLSLFLLSALSIPFVFIVAVCLKKGGARWFIPGLLIVMVVHCRYNLYFIRGYLG